MSSTGSSSIRAITAESFPGIVKAYSLMNEFKARSDALGGMFECAPEWAKLSLTALNGGSVVTETDFFGDEALRSFLLCRSANCSAAGVTALVKSLRLLDKFSQGLAAGTLQDPSGGLLMGLSEQWTAHGGPVNAIRGLNRYLKILEQTPSIGTETTFFPIMIEKPESNSPDSDYDAGPESTTGGESEASQMDTAETQIQVISEVADSVASSFPTNTTPAPARQQGKRALKFEAHRYETADAFRVRQLNRNVRSFRQKLDDSQADLSAMVARMGCFKEFQDVDAD